MTEERTYRVIGGEEQKVLKLWAFEVALLRKALLGDAMSDDERQQAQWLGDALAARMEAEMNLIRVSWQDLRFDLWLRSSPRPPVVKAEPSQP